MIDFISHLLESMLCKAISRSPGVSGDTLELPSPDKRRWEHESFIWSDAKRSSCAGVTYDCCPAASCCHLLCWVPSRRLKTSFTTIGLSLISFGRAWMTSFYMRRNRQNEQMLYLSIEVLKILTLLCNFYISIFPLKVMLLLYYWTSCH